MTALTDDIDVEVRELIVEEGRAFFDEQARKRLGISGEEFIEGWRSGKYRTEEENTDVTWLEMLLPFANEPPLTNDR